jgi:hypothetical protein
MSILRTRAAGRSGLIRPIAGGGKPGILRCSTHGNGRGGRPKLQKCLNPLVEFVNVLVGRGREPSAQSLNTVSWQSGSRPGTGRRNQ